MFMSPHHLPTAAMAAFWPVMREKAGMMLGNDVRTVSPGLPSTKAGGRRGNVPECQDFQTRPKTVPRPMATETSLTTLRAGRAPLAAAAAGCRKGLRRSVLADRGGTDRRCAASSYGQMADGRPQMADGRRLTARRPAYLTLPFLFFGWKQVCVFGHFFCACCFR